MAGIELGFGRRGEANRVEARPMRVLVIDDLGARGHAGLRESSDDLARRRLPAVDVDNLEVLLSGYAPRLTLEMGGATIDLDFQELDDFHPDTLYRRLEVFEALRELRRRLRDPKTFPQAAAALRHEAAPGEREAAGESEEDLVSRLLGRPPEATPPPASPAARGIDALLHRLVAPHIVPEADPRQDSYIASVDIAIGDQMRALLHHPAFQDLEASWRSLHDLVTSLETGEDLSIHVLDLAREDLIEDLVANRDDLTRSGLYRLLVEQGPATTGGDPWSLLVSGFDFGPDEKDLVAVQALGKVAAHAGGPFLAGARPALLGVSHLVPGGDPRDWPALSEAEEARWRALRRDPAARWLGLALPHLLLRLPYGEDGEPIDGFAFEELPAGAGPDDLLWGAPALALARLLAEDFRARGWAMRPGDHLDLGDLPAYVATREGERVLQPCAEVLLSERAGEAILGRGLIPLMSYKHRNAVRVLRLQSLADPPAALAGPWD